MYPRHILGSRKEVAPVFEKGPALDQLPKRFLVTAPNSVFQLAEFMGLRLV